MDKDKRDAAVSHDRELLRKAQALPSFRWDECDYYIERCILPEYAEKIRRVKITKFHLDERESI